MTRLEVRYEAGDTTHVVGELLSVRQGVYFQYNPAFQATGMELSPIRLPSTIAAPIENRDRTNGGLHGVFNDSLPDGWGMIVMDRALRALGIDVAALSPVDRLAFVGTRTMGALTYHPPMDADESPIAVDITAAAAQADRMLDGSPEQVLPEVLRAGGSPMGARPKIVAGVSHDFKRIVTGVSTLPEGYSHWLIKFATKPDAREAGGIEMAYAAMARVAGIDVPETHLFEGRDGRRHFGIQRFDRDPANPSRRIHMHTFAGLLNLDFRVPAQDYTDLLNVTRALTRNHQDVVAAFRQMVFNIFAHNRDDHTKNFAFLMSADGEWKLSPAYDLVFAPGPGGEHTLTVDGAGKAPTINDIARVAEKASLQRREVDDVLDSVRAAVSEWREFAGMYDISRSATRDIEERLTV